MSCGSKVTAMNWRIKRSSHGWVGRQGKGGQAWLTYHLSPQDEIQFQYRNVKASSAFLPGGTTQNDYSFLVSKRVRQNIEIRGWAMYEGWKAPLYKSGAQSDTTASVQVTWFLHEPK